MESILDWQKEFLDRRYSQKTQILTSGPSNMPAGLQTVLYLAPRQAVLQPSPCGRKQQVERMWGKLGPSAARFGIHLRDQRGFAQLEQATPYQQQYHSIGTVLLFLSFNAARRVVTTFVLGSSTIPLTSTWWLLCLLI